MATFDLHISCSNIDEFSDIARRLCGTTSLTPAQTEMKGMPAAHLSAPLGESETEEKPKRGRKVKADTTVPQPTQNPDSSPIEPVKEPLPQPTPGGTEAPPAESIPPKQDAAAQADVFGGGEASTGTPAATAGGDAAVVDLPALKNAMAELLRVKNAQTAMNLLEAATGCKSLSTGSPSVIEKAKDDPGIMQRALDALVAAKTAA